MAKASIIMGLDISTSTIGISVISKNKSIKLKHLSYYKPLNVNLDKPEVLDMLLDAKQHILKIATKYKPTHIAIENIIKFMKGRSSANSTLSLAIINRTLGLALYEHTNIKAEFINVNTIRAKLKHYSNFGKHLAKEDVPGTLEKLMNIKFPYEYDLNKNKKKIAERSYDMADALAVSYVFAKEKL